MAATPVRIAIIANAAQAKRELNSFSGGLSSTFKKVGRFAAIGAAVAGAALLKFGTDSVKAASDAQQSLGATETVFGKFANTVIKTSDKAATSYGLSANQYRESANLLGSLFKNQGVAVTQLAGKTQGMIGVGTDLAATFGGTTATAVEALGSAFKGEFDSLEKYGISLKQSSVNAEASSIAQKKYGKSLTDLSLAQQTAAKQEATSNLIMKQSASSRGAFARENDTLAHQTQVLGAQFENLKVKIGNVLLPVLTTVFKFINAEAIPAITKFGEKLGAFLAPYIDKAKAAFSSLMDSLQPVTDWFAKHPEIIKGAAIALGIAAAAALAFAAAMVVVSIATSPITLVVLAIAAVGGAIYYAYKNSETFRNAITAIKDAAVATFGWLQTNVLPILQQIGQFYAAMFARIKQATSAGLAIIRALWGVFGGTIKSFLSNTFANLKNIVEGGLRVIRGIIKVVTSIIKGDWSGAWNGIKMILSGAWQAIRGIASQGVNMIKSLLSAGWQAAKALTSAAWNALKSVVSHAISGMLGIVRGIPGKITGALGDLGGLLAAAGRSLIDGLIGGITDKIGDLQGVLNSVTDKIPDWKGPKEKDKNLLKPTGHWIMDGLIRGIEDGSSGVKDVLGKVTDGIEKYVKKHFRGAKGQALITKVTLHSLRDEYKALSKNGKAQDKNTERLKKAKDALKSLVTERANFASSIKNAAIDYTNITGLGTAFNSKALAAELRHRLEKIKNFAAIMQDLIRKGLNQTMIAQLSAAGVEGGLATALAIQQGGTGAIAEFNSLQTQISTAATGLGNTAADDMYNAGIAAAQGLVRGLEKEAKNLDKAAIRLANALVKAVKKALGIKSPSKVFEGIGDYVTKGLVIGLDQTYVKRSGEMLASSLTKGFGEPTMNAAVASSTGGATGTTYQINVKADATTDRVALGRSIVSAIDAYELAGGKRRA